MHLVFGRPYPRNACMRLKSIFPMRGVAKKKSFAAHLKNRFSFMKRRSFSKLCPQKHSGNLILARKKLIHIKKIKLNV
jgi:hypothetical protein